MLILSFTPTNRSCVDDCFAGWPIAAQTAQCRPQTKRQSTPKHSLPIALVSSSASAESPNCLQRRWGLRRTPPERQPTEDGSLPTKHLSALARRLPPRAHLQRPLA